MAVILLPSTKACRAALSTRLDSGLKASRACDYHPGMPSSTVENYVKQIYLLQDAADPSRRVSMGRVAEAMGVVPGTATTMIKTLLDAGLVDYEPCGGVRLTAGGEKLALHVLRRHRLIEQFLVQVVGLDWSEVHEEAEQLEHVVSERLINRIDTLLNYPTVDPHGDPIPSSQGRVDREELRCLADLLPGDTAQVARVSDQEAGFLRLLKHHELQPGRAVRMLERDQAADAVTLQTDGQAPFTVGMKAAAKIWVK
jgi:DtxR family transcriptional regulator, Mn-dependent transcriptional regulator